MKILRVDMGKGCCLFEEIHQYDGLGGRGLTSAVVAREVDPTTSALGAGNKLVFAPGLLGGTKSANSGRISVGCKSPLTGGIKESNSGGQPGGYLARLGLSAVIIENQAREGDFFILELGLGRAQLIPAESLAGLNNYDTVRNLETRYPGAAFISIGRAGEYRLLTSSIAFTDKDGQPTRQAGRGGVGAVMGAKGLKAMIIDPFGTPDHRSPHDLAAFTEASKCFASILSNHPVCGGSLATYGSAGMMGFLNEAGVLPTRNFTSGRFEKQEAISGEKLNQLTRERGGQGRVARGCMSGCIIRCSGVFPDREGKRIGKWPDYETLWAFGPNTGIGDLEVIARYDRLCDDLGVDTIDVGGAIALLMEAGVLEFGDAKGALKLVAEIGQGSDLGRVIGSGAVVCGQVYGQYRVAAVKGQAMPAFDPRSVKGQGVTFATNPQGADHTAGLAYTSNLLGFGEEVDPLSREGQVELSRRTQVSAAMVDTLGLCLFVSFAVFESNEAMSAVVEMINALYGWNLSVGDVERLGVSVLETEVDFNRRAGLSEIYDRLPGFFSEEKDGSHKSTFDIKDAELDKVLKW